MKGCPDFDEDGWADSADAFFQDETQWSDGDGDGFGDNPLETTLTTAHSSLETLAWIESVVSILMVTVTRT